MKSLEELRALKAQMQSKMGIRNDDNADVRVVVGMATCGIAAGAKDVVKAFSNEIAKRNINNVAIMQTGCIGMCQYEPVVEVYVGNEEKVTYVNMSADKVAKVVDEHIVNGNVVTEYTVGAVKQ